VRRNRWTWFALLAVIGAGAAACILAVDLSGFTRAAAANEQIDNFLSKLRGSRLPAGIVQSNGRLEAEQVGIATKFAGRVVEVLAEEGQMVDAGDVLARLDATELEAQLRALEAQVRRADSSREQAEAAVAQRASELDLAKHELERTESLHQKGFATNQLLDQRRSQVSTATSAHRAAVAALEMTKSAIEAAEADAARLKSLVGDTVLTAPRRGRIQYKLAQPGEVVAAGARVLTLIDLADVYMTIFLPARDIGRLSLGDEARLILDPIPQYVVPATISFVAADAQFTPKSVETADEREKLVFRVKLKIAPELLRKYEPQVKTGVRGLGFVRTTRDAVWPARLAIKLPQ
jgi:HlyD family secretion protein